jgi:ABC-type transporter Mla MlaB component
MSMAKRTRPTVLVCDLRDLQRPHLGTVDALARLKLQARRCGRELRLRNASPALVELLALAGLEEVLPVEPGGEPEEREEALGVEEEGELGDAAGR